MKNKIDVNVKEKKEKESKLQMSSIFSFSTKMKFICKNMVPPTFYSLISTKNKEAYAPDCGGGIYTVEMCLIKLKNNIEKNHSLA